MKRTPITATLAVALFSVATPAHAEDPIEITTQLNNPPLPGDPDGSCSDCRVFPLAYLASDPDDAKVDLYFEDDGDDLLADIQVDVLLDDDSTDTVYVYDFQLYDQQTSTIDVASATGWDFDEVVHVWVTVIPAE